MTRSEATPGGGAVAFGRYYYFGTYRDYERQNPETKMAYYKAVLDRFMAPGMPRRIHDVGCAFGVFLRHLGSHWQAVGTDVSEFAIAEARRRVPWAEFRVQGAVHAPPGSPGYGAVTALDVAEHVPDLAAFAACVREQLAPGGLFMFVVPVYDGLSGPFVRLLDRDPTHLHRWPRHAWLEWAAGAFQLVHWEGILRFLVPGGSYLHVPTRALRKHAPAILAVCRRA